MKKIAIIFSVVAFIFAFTTSSVSAQKAPEKAKTEKVSDSKAPATDAKAGCSDKAKAECGDKAKAECGDKAKAGCASAKAGCCGSKAAATPVPAPEKK